MDLSWRDGVVLQRLLTIAAQWAPQKREPLSFNPVRYMTAAPAIVGAGGYRVRWPGAWHGQYSEASSLAGLF
jgi:hypothetical protein